MFEISLAIADGIIPRLVLTGSLATALAIFLLWSPKGEKTRTEAKIAYVVIMALVVPFIFDLIKVAA